MAIKELTLAKCSSAVKAIANYYRHEPIFVNIANREDVYQWYIDNYYDTCEGIIEQGNSYMFKDNYLLAIDVEDMKTRNLDLYNSAVDAVPHLIKHCEKEKSPVMYIICFGPKKDFMGPDAYKLINEFVDMYRSDYVILTDCMADIDIDKFGENTGAQRIQVNGSPFFRWSKSS